eukprot:417354-Prorocentrum_minimum.AAC.1
MVRSEQKRYREQAPHVNACYASQGARLVEVVRRVPPPPSREVGREAVRGVPRGGGGREGVGKGSGRGQEAVGGVPRGGGGHDEAAGGVSRGGVYGVGRVSGGGHEAVLGLLGGSG